MQNSQKFLDNLNESYFKLHKKYEELYWISYMGDHSVDKEKDEALSARDTFKSNSRFIEKIKALMPRADTKTKKRLMIWLEFFNRHQTPPQAAIIKDKINNLESDILKKRSERKEGYIDPSTNKFIEASSLKMATMIDTHNDERVRKACFDSRQKLALGQIDEYIEVVRLRNQYAQMLGYTDFYDFKVQREDGMTKDELFSIFDSIYEETKYAKQNIKKIEKKMPGLRKPWNFSYMIAGDFTKEEDPYFQFDDALPRWGKSFAALGIDFKGGVLQLDLLDRKRKWNNGFCHWPNIVRFKNSKRIAGSSNFTCNVVFGQVGSGKRGYETLFHEGGHAAHFLNVEQQETCLNTEYSPMSAAWAETHSMFIDTLFKSIEWRTRYAMDKNGNTYPFDLYQRMITELHPLRPLDLNGIIFVSNFEREIYETKNLTKEKAVLIANKNFRKYYERSEDSLAALNVPHIYSWDSSGSYHGYGLATLALHQWREYFYKKYGYIVDNPHVGKEMSKVWKLGSSKTFKEFVILSTGKKLSAKAYLREVTSSIEDIIKKAKARIEKLEKVKLNTRPIKLNTKIRMLHGKKEISNNGKSFEDMAHKYKVWLNSNKEN